MSERARNPLISLLIERLSKLDAGGRARFKRSAGRPLAEARDCLSLFYRVLPKGVHPAQEESYFMIATLYPLAKQGKVGNLGDSLRRATDESNRKGIERRIETLLDSDVNQLSFRLRQAVRFINSNDVAIDWQQLLDDVLQWSHPRRFVQKQWAKAYFSDHGDAKPLDTRTTSDQAGNSVTK